MRKVETDKEERLKIVFYFSITFIALKHYLTLRIAVLQLLGKVSFSKSNFINVRFLRLC